ncbi:MAG: prepilin-type N-terminal cleavage/methylation domain-containing protein [candidate division Zixibacteria bacterium]|nr:prepilin-type N-terminal cleavage/methylation domain-containing protein [candidate division Zixibacteria bacterium]
MRSLRSRRQSSRRSRPRLRSESGFSLIELLIVLVIIGILAGIAIPRYMSSTTKAKQVEAKELLHQIYMMERSYFLEHDGYWIPDVGVEASKDYPYAFDQIGVEIMSSARYTYTIEETESGFRAVATSYKLDDDPAVDRWSITESGSLIPESDDSVER